MLFIEKSINEIGSEVMRLIKYLEIIIIVLKYLDYKKN